MANKRSIAQTPAPKKDRIYGSKVNPKGSASSEKSAKSIKLSSDIILALTKKLKEFKENHNTKKVTLSDLKAVYRRGLGAYSSSHRPTISGGKPNTRNAWAMARVNAFLRKAGGGEYKKAYVQDDDLLKFKDGGLLAPNGKPSNLTPEQYRLVRTPEFKAWFGDWENNPANASKVVDENGEPLVVYHGTTKNFNVFKISKFGAFGRGIYFSNDINYAKQYSVGENIIIFAFLNIKNPQIGAKKVPNILRIEEVQQKEYDKMINEKYDGIIVKNEKTHSFEIVAFYPEQIKLADGTNTTFDGSNADVRYDGGGELKSFYRWFIDWYKGVNDKLDIIISLPNEVSGLKSVPYKEDNVMVLDMFRKKDQSINAKPYLQQILDKADEYGVTIYLMPEPNHKYIDDINYRKKINTKYLIDYYSGFGFELTPNKEFMKRLPKYKEGGEVPKDLRELPYYKGAYKGAEFYSMEDGEYQKMADRWYNLMLKHQGGKKLNKKEFEEFEKLSYDLYKSDEYKDGGEVGDEILQKSISQVNSSFTKEILPFTIIPSNKNQFVISVVNVRGGKEILIDYYFSKKNGSLIKQEVIETRNIEYKEGGEVDKHKETYAKWKSLVNMSYSELKRFYDSEEGKVAGLKPSEAKAQGIDSGRESARWIMKMKKTPVSEWTPQMWKWANKQISFISRMSGGRGELYDEKGNKTRKYLSLLIWGNDPKKKNNGGMIKYNIKVSEGLSDETIKQMLQSSLEKLKYYKDRGYTKERLIESKKFTKSWLDKHYAKGGDVDSENQKFLKRFISTKIDSDKEKFIMKYLKDRYVDMEKTPYKVLRNLVKQANRYYETERIKTLPYKYYLVSYKIPAGASFSEKIYARTPNEARKNFMQYNKGDKIKSVTLIKNKMENGGEVKDKFNYRIITQDGRIKYAGTDMPSWFNLEEARKLVNYSKGEMIYEYDNKGEKIWEIFEDGGTINQSINTNIMDEIKFNQLPHIDTISSNDNVLIRESVFAGNLDKPKHIGERYIHCQVMGEGGMINSLNLKVVNSVGANALRVGEVISRPITNVLTRGRKLIVEPIANAMPKFKEGGLNPDNKEVKQYFAHDSGNAGGVLVGKRHSEGGIKAINKGTGQPLEMEGGEVVITRGAVSNPKKYQFQNKEMTTREILSKLNVDGGGVSFAEGGDVPDKMNCGCDKMDFGGTTMSIQEFVTRSDNEYQEHRLKAGIQKERNDHYDTLSKLNAGTITIDQALREIAQKEMKLDLKYPFAE